LIPGITATETAAIAAVIVENGSFEVEFATAKGSESIA
jgi:hypothetical protein